MSDFETLSAENDELSASFLTIVKNLDADETLVESFTEDMLHMIEFAFMSGQTLTLINENKLTIDELSEFTQALSNLILESEQVSDKEYLEKLVKYVEMTRTIILDAVNPGAKFAVPIPYNAVLENFDTPLNWDEQAQLDALSVMMDVYMRTLNPDLPLSKLNISRIEPGEALEYLALLNKFLQKSDDPATKDLKKSLLNIDLDLLFPKLINAEQPLHAFLIEALAIATFSGEKLDLSGKSITFEDWEPVIMMLEDSPHLAAHAMLDHYNMYMAEMLTSGTIERSPLLFSDTSSTGTISPRPNTPTKH